MELDNEALTKEGMSDRDQKIPKLWREQICNILGPWDSVNTQHNRFPNMVKQTNGQFSHEEGTPSCVKDGKQRTWTYSFIAQRLMEQRTPEVG